MSSCNRVRRCWNALKDIVYGYKETTYQWNGKREEKEAREKTFTKNVHFSTDPRATETGWFFQEYKLPPEKRRNYCIPRCHTTYEAYGIGFETRQERDAFESKMESMERIFEKELYDLKRQHERLRKKRSNASTLPGVGKKSHFRKTSATETGHNTWLPSLISENYESSTYLPTDDDPLIEEISLVNELHDIYEHMCNLSKELKNVEKLLTIEIRKRTLHPEPRLIHIKVPEDEHSEQMKNDGGLTYCSSDSSVQQITYATLPPPLTLSSLLADEEDET